MDVNLSGALGALAYQTTLNQTGSPSQALLQSLAAGQSQAAEAGSLIASVGPTDPQAGLAGGAGSQALASFAYGTSATAGKGPEAVQALLATLGGTTAPALLPSSDNLPVSAAALSPSTTAALVRYAYDQSQTPAAATQQAIASGQQTLLNTGLNLLA
jgi:hypothetical protein